MRPLPAIALAAAGIVLAGCTPLSTTPHVVGSLSVAADLPLSGDDAPDGAPVENAIRLAIAQAGRVCGFSSHTDACVTLSTAFDDEVSKGIHDPATGARNLQALAGDGHVVGVIGPLYDSLARTEIPIATAAGLALISPANTDECLTQEPADGHCHGEASHLRPRGGNAYFRVVTTQLNEGTAAADMAITVLKRRHAFVVDDGSTLGHALADAFRSRWQRLGGDLVNASDSSAAARLGADVVYFAGVDIAAAAALRRQMAGVMPAVPLIGSDRLASPQFALAAGVQARGSYYTVPGCYPPGLKGGASFIRAYQRAAGTDPPPSALAAFDATNLLLRAIAHAIDDAGGGLPTRAQVLHQVATTADFHGVMGTMGFDARGDTTLRLVSVYQWMAPTDRAGRFSVQLSLQ